MTTTVRLGFDLLTAPWIPCIDHRGSRCELGVFDVFTLAHQLLEVRDTSPLTTVALLRLLIAIARHGMPLADNDEWRDAWERGAFPADVSTHISGSIGDTIPNSSFAERIFGMVSPKLVYRKNQLVVPTRVGVNRFTGAGSQPCASCPHARGGEPK